MRTGPFGVSKLGGATTPTSLEFDSLPYVLQNMRIWKPNDMKRGHNDDIAKNSGKIWTSRKPAKLYIIRKVLTKFNQKYIFY